MGINKKIILASGSPRRIEIMHQHGFDPVVHPADVDENIPSYRNVREVPMYLALKKALHVLMETAEDDGIIIAADTIVYNGDPWGDGEIMGKPADPDDGFRMLSELRGGHHLVITGVCLVDIRHGIKKVFCDTTEVWFTDYSDEELRAYLETPEAYDKAGGYAIQGTFGKYISKIDGSYDNVIGFPWTKIQYELNLLQEVLL